MLHIGCHLSSSKGFLNMGKVAEFIGADTFQFFTRNPRGSASKEWNDSDITDFMNFAKKHNFAPIVAHCPYTLNPCSADEKTREFAHIVMEDDLRKMEQIPHNYYNFHPGSHTGLGVDAGIELIAELLNKLLKENQTTTVLLETMSGKGSEIGSTFEEIARIINKLELKDKIGVCMDTCHIYSAGYDIVHSLDKVLADFEQIIGLKYLKAIHLNDSMTEFASHKDRHEKIGQGTIGKDAIINIINNPHLRDKVFVLETPNELDGYAAEIKMLRNEYR